MPSEVQATYWSDADVQAGKWIVMPNTRVAKLHHVCNGRKVFITSDGKLVCEHGEVSRSIWSWITAEQRAKSAGIEPPPHNSACDCANTDGLHWTKEMPESLVSIDPPSDTLFGVLNELDTGKVVVRGHALRHVPHTQTATRHSLCLRRAAYSVAATATRSMCYVQCRKARPKGLKEEYAAAASRSLLVGLG